MSRIFHRPMFRKGGSAGGITSCLRQGYATGGGDLEADPGTEINPEIVATKTEVEEKVPSLSYADFGEIKPPEAPGFDWGSFGLNLMSGPSKGDIFSDIGEAGKEPYSRYRQGRAAYDMNKYKHKLAERQFNLEVYKALNDEDKIGIQKEIDYLVKTFGISEEEALNRVMPQYRKKADPSEQALKDEQAQTEKRQRQRNILMDQDTNLKYDDQAERLLKYRENRNKWKESGYTQDDSQVYLDIDDVNSKLIPNEDGSQLTYDGDNIKLDGDYIPGKIYVDVNSNSVYLFDGSKFTEVSLDVEDIKS